MTEPELPRRFVGELTPELILGVPGGNPNAPASVSEREPSLGSDAPVNVIESPEPLKLIAIFVAFGLKNEPVNGVVL